MNSSGRTTLLQRPQSLCGIPVRLAGSPRANGDGLGDPDHTVEHADSEGSFGLLTGQIAGAKFSSDQVRIVADGSLDEAMPAASPSGPAGQSTGCGNHMEPGPRLVGARHCKAHGGMSASDGVGLARRLLLLIPNVSDAARRTMGQGEVCMKLLLADTDPARARWIERELSGGLVREIVRLESGETLIDGFERHAPDVIVVDMARPDRDALDSVRYVAARLPGPVVMFVDHDDDAFMEEAIAAGVSSYTVLGQALPDIQPIMRAAVALFRRYRALQDELERSRSQPAAAGGGGSGEGAAHPQPADERAGCVSLAAARGDAAGPAAGGRRGGGGGGARGPGLRNGDAAHDAERADRTAAPGRCGAGDRRRGTRDVRAARAGCDRCWWSRPGPTSPTSWPMGCWMRR